jgi:hypothetical protein
MANHLKKVRIGDVITAEIFNELVEAAQQGLHLSAAFPLVLERNPGGVLLRLAHQTSVKFVELQADLAAGATAAPGNVLDFDPDEGEWVDTTSGGSFSPQSIEKIAEPHDAGLYLNGERRVVYFDRESGFYLPLSLPGPHLAVASEQIDRGESGLAVVRTVNEAGELAETELELTVWNWLLPRVWSDAPCTLMLHPQSRKWYLAQAYSATLVLANVSTSGGVTGMDAEFDVDEVLPLNGFFPETTITSVRNTFQHEFEEDARVALVWNDTDLVWETWQGECPAEET